ncbi:HAD family hydrolase [Cryobacterium sp. Hh38]|uniref:HAD family hydrolase n=1 Tax=Cryobacterium sp. Hh38 TaxID=1259156 RepID=UPI00106A8182|nr:HAD family hydrolase [Cryobacterium sp. Hh38]TFD60375.1 HAD family hydrolase [Cryobacterium sp. Hh38]
MQAQFLNTSIDVSASLLPGAASAIIFDCDGLLADTEDLWLRAVAACANERGTTLTDLAGFRGGAIDDVAVQLVTILAAAGLPTPSVNKLEVSLSEEFQSLIAQEATAMPGAVALVSELASRFPVAVASNSPRALLDQILERIGVRDLITCSVARDEVSAGKPAPELYVAALRKLHELDPLVTAETAVAFEDSAVGALAAMSAGLLVVGVNADPKVVLNCHVRHTTLLEEELVDWTRILEREKPAQVGPYTFVGGSFDAATSTLTVQCQYPAEQTARVQVYAQSDCLWNELPAGLPVASASVPNNRESLSIDLAHLPDGTYRFLLVTDGLVPEWNGRTGEFTVRTTVPVAQSAAPQTAAPATFTPESPERGVTAMTWNLWFGGCHSNDGHAKQVAYLRESSHSIVALQESFGDHGRRLAAAMGWNIAQQGHDTAVISPYPLSLHQTETDPFATCATVFTPTGAVTVWSAHLWHSDYGPYTADDARIPARYTLASRGERRRTGELAKILSEQGRLEREGVVSAQDSILIMGDFNVPSHLDWKPGHRANTVEWPTSRMLEVAGYADAFRVVHPNVGVAPGHTWSPIIPSDEEPRDRIDFIFSRGARALAAYTVAGEAESEAPPKRRIGENRQVGLGESVLGHHLENAWPTDHAAVVARLHWN